MQEATCCTPSLASSPKARAQGRARRKAVCSDSKSAGSQQRHRMLQAAALAETDTQGSRQDLPHPWQDMSHFRFPSSYGGIEHTKSAGNPGQNRWHLPAFHSYLLLTVQRRILVRHILCPALTVQSVFCLLCVEGWQGGRNPAFFMSRTRILLQAKPILSSHQA